MTMKRAWLACFALAGAACDSKSGAEKFADSYCAEVAKCCKQAGISGDGQICHFAFTGGGSYNASAGDACLAEVRAEVAAGTFCTGGGTAASACDKVMTSASGKKQPGETCDFESDCAASSEGKVACESADTGSTGISKCQVQMPGKAGDSCIGTQDGDTLSFGGSRPTEVAPRAYVCNVADGLECLSGTCVALATVGASCHYSNDCVRTAYCDGTDHCAARIAAGATCTGADTDECAAGTYCPTTSPRQCVAKLAIGASCSSDDMCTSANCESSTCKPNLLDNVGWQVLCS
jgi:hypothetical protein